MTRIAAGDTSAVAACLDEFGGLVFSLADRYLRPLGGDVDDAVQEIFVEVWRCAGRYDASFGSEASFIATIAHRRLIDQQRRYGARPRMTAAEPEHVQPVTKPEPPAAAMSEDLRKAMDAMGHLEHDEQEVLHLALYRGLSHSRIAAALNIPIGTVKTRIRRGLVRVREILSPSFASAATFAGKGGGS